MYIRVSLFTGLKNRLKNGLEWTMEFKKTSNFFIAIEGSAV